MFFFNKKIFTIKLCILSFIVINNSFSKSEKTKQEDLVLIDGIASLRIGSSGLTPTYYSDAWFLNPLGMQKNLEDIVIQNMWIAYGHEHGIKMISNESSVEYAEQYLDMLQSQKNVSRKQIEDMAEELGYTIEDIKKELNNQYIIQQTIQTHFAASGKLNITHREIQDYYNSLSVSNNNLYVIQKGKLIFPKDKKIDNSLDHINKYYKKITWSDPYEVKYEELNQNFSHINTCKKDDIIYFNKNEKNNFFTIYKFINVVAIEKPSLTNIYEDIVQSLQAIKYQEGLNMITSNFLSSDFMIYDTPEIREKCLNTIKK